MEHIKRLFLRDGFILSLILFNAFTIFSSGFIVDASMRYALDLADHLITCLFLVELLVKLREYGWKGYFGSGWNRLDFILIMLALPSLVAWAFDLAMAGFSWVLALRVLRVFKSLRFFKFIPGFHQLVLSIIRALKASVFVLLGFAIYLFLISVLSFHFFGDYAPQYFSNPARALYSTFMIFTVDGWAEVPEAVTGRMSSSLTVLTHLYFVFVVLSGGVFGMSLVNSIFVDAMVSDNTDELEDKVTELDRKISLLLEREERTKEGS